MSTREQQARSGPATAPEDAEVASDRRDALLVREWLVANGKGGYASGTVAGMLTRRFHGLLISALTGPVGRTVMLSQVTERVRMGDDTVDLEAPDATADDGLMPSIERLEEFRLDAGLPVWRFRLDGTGGTLERRVAMPHMQNTVHVTYRLRGRRDGVRLELRPWMHFRPHQASLEWKPPSREGPEPQPEEEGPGGEEPRYAVTARGSRLEVEDPEAGTTLRIWVEGRGMELILDGGSYRQLRYRKEASRGYDSSGRLWNPGRMSVHIPPNGSVTLVASTEDWTDVAALPPSVAREREGERRRRLVDQAPIPRGDETAAALVLAADQFIVAPPGRRRELQRIRAGGDEGRTVIAGYHWFTDWGRDTMISLEGLTLDTGRPVEGGWILRTFAHYVQDGLIPNLFPEGGDEGLYNTADATLWFFQAVHRYVSRTGDRATLRQLLPTLREIVDHHIAGTRFGIGVDPEDGLLVQGQEGFALTWMDAKVDHWVVTPRRGKAVEINALWYNALRLMSGWLRDAGDEEAARALATRADGVQHAFNDRFWYEEGGYLLDVVDCREPVPESARASFVDGSDASIRPNQLFSFSLTHPVLRQERWPAVLSVVEDRLLTPVGLRTLNPGHPAYQERYFGDLRARDAAYHQGTVWPWLLGPWVDAWLRAHPEDDPREARRFLQGLVPCLERDNGGTIPEIFDAEEPFTARGCVAQAWSVAEMLRAWLRTADDPGSGRSG